MSSTTITTTTTTTIPTPTAAAAAAAKPSTRPRSKTPTAHAASSTPHKPHAPPSISLFPRTPTRSLRKQIPGPRVSGGLSSRSTPNLGALFAAHARAAQAAPPLPRLPHQPSLPSLQPPSLQPPPLLLRKGSLAALTSSSLATIPDASESYAFDTLNEDDDPGNISASTGTGTTTSNSTGTGTATTTSTMTPHTPGSRLTAPFSASMNGGGGGDDVAVGDHVDVPGGMTGVVRFVGSVAGRKGVFAGVELQREHAARGKNNGDVDGVSYFNTTVPGAGIFLPLSKATRRESPAGFPMTPNGTGLKLGSQNSTNYTPPTPSLPKFSQSVSAAGRASPQGRRPPRTSLPRPDSPVRRLNMTPVPPVPSRPSMTPARQMAAPGRFGSPTGNKFSQSVRATPGGDSNKRTLGRRPSIGPRSVSALSARSMSHAVDDDTTPMAPSRMRMNGKANSNGSISSASSFNQKNRSPSRAAGGGVLRNGNGTTAAAEEELGRLRSELADRERQLKDQATTLTDMESSLTELQTLIENSDMPPGGGPGGMNGELDDKDLAEMRALLREKNDKIAMLTSEFDAHRADFRSTIDTLEMASTETERVYEKKIEELMQEIHELESRTSDVDAVAQQLKQLEELVQELEEGLEDARRGEAEARGEVEFLRGEVERTRTELLREREKVAAAAATTNGRALPSRSKDLEQKDDEIRGLKAIIHSLSQNATADSPEKTPTGQPGSWQQAAGGGPGSPTQHRRGESINERLAREKLEREVAELRGQLDTKTSREAEMERELEQLRANGANGANGANAANAANAVLGVNGVARNSTATINTIGTSRSSRDSRGTVVLAREYHSNSNSSHHHQASSSSSLSLEAVRKTHHSRGSTLDTMPESDAYSSVTDTSTLWCEICETNGHDILTCTNMFGPQSQQAAAANPAGGLSGSSGVRTGKDVVRAAGLQANSNLAPPPPPLPLLPNGQSRGNVNGHSYADSNTLPLPPPPLSPLSPRSPMSPSPLSPVRSTAASKTVPADVKILPNPMDSGPVAGKESGVVDADKWCALCERDGHDSVDCPFEDAF